MSLCSSSLESFQEFLKIQQNKYKIFYCLLHNRNTTYYRSSARLLAASINLVLQLTPHAFKQNPAHTGGAVDVIGICSGASRLITFWILTVHYADFLVNRFRSTACVPDSGLYNQNSKCPGFGVGTVPNAVYEAEFHFPWEKEYFSPLQASESNAWFLKTRGRSSVCVQVPDSEWILPKDHFIVNSWRILWSWKFLGISHPMTAITGKQWGQKVVEERIGWRTMWPRI